MSYYGRGGDLISLNEEIQPSVVYFWCEDTLYLGTKLIIDDEAMGRSYG